MPNYYCEYCGMKYSSAKALLAARCPRHPLGPGKGNHKLYEGSEKIQYICKYCGLKFSSISSMVRLRCTRHPNGPAKGGHAPAL